ncbi:MAG: energy-coupling factor transporter transmembrane protein EcfT [Candidatus Accumulibacter sp.]|jgi:energy-coupling factor transporter transmembrane protein EcfT|nr:energy-coupling factor transporter transmembrane protein EcfT [Accumulibacter sp.]
MIWKWNCRAIHPATRLAAWLAVLVAVQSLDGAVLLAACLAAPLSGRRAMRPGGRLIWRARWLLVSLLLVFAWGVPGEPLWIGGLAPTREGVGEALKHSGRLLLVLIAVAAFLETMPLADLLAGARALLAPLRRLGVDTDRGIVRLTLALRYVETLPRPRDWKALLEIPETVACETIEIDHPPMRWIDGCLVAGLLAALALFCFR